jgi:hypothetical protein
LSISREGEKFLLDLNAYLIASGKDEDEVRNFIEQAEKHLAIGEKEGKSIEDIFGPSPIVYAKSIEKELGFDKKGILEIGLSILLFIFTWTFLNKLSDLIPSFSILEAIGNPLVFLISFSAFIFSFRRFVFEDKKLAIAGMSIFIFQILAFVIIGLISKDMPHPIILNKLWITIIVGVLFIINLIVGIKTNSLTCVLLPFIINLSGILNHILGLNLGKDTSLIFLILGFLILFVDTKMKLKKQH